MIISCKRNLSKTFTIDIGKESLTNEFERQAATRKERIRTDQEPRELDRCYADIEAAIQGAGAKPEKRKSKGFER